MSKIEGLGYEQLIALRIISTSPTMDVEFIDLRKQADCSWDELLELKNRKLVMLGKGIWQDKIFASLTDDGHAALAEDNAREITQKKESRP